MSQVIVYTNDQGNVSVCTPAGQMPIDHVLANDCPAHAVIVDASGLPQADDDFFNAWRLVNGAVVVDINAARAIQLAKFNSDALNQAQKRQMNTLSGITNDVSDADFLTSLNTKRAAIAAAKTTDDLRAVTL